MKNLITLYLVLGVCAGLLSQSTQTTTRQNNSLVEIDEFITAYMDSVHKPGLSACIIKGDSIVWRGNYGYADVENQYPVTKDKLFYAYSIGKSITATSVMKLWEDSIISLDENVNGFLPFQVDNPNFDYDSITPRMLMTHTSSIVDYGLYGYATIGDATMSLHYFLENYLSVGGAFYSNENFSAFTPGTSYNYSNFGYALDGFLAEVLMDTLFKDYAKDSVLLPLDMDNSVWFLNEIDTNNLALGYLYQGGEYVPYPNYGHPAYPGLTLKSSSEELAHFDMMLMNGGNYQGEQILESNTVDTMCTVQMNLLYCGLGLYKRVVHCENEDKTTWGHKGGGTYGYAAEMKFCPDENIGVVYMSNSAEYATPVVERLFEYGTLIIVPEEATNIWETSFTASWQVAPDAVEYYFDVAYDWQFTNFVEGYENLNVGLDTAIEVTGLEAGTKYYYRITAHNGIELGPTSTAVVTTTQYVNTDEQELSENFIFFPNPGHNTLHILWQTENKGPATITIYNQLGQKTGSEIPINTSATNNEFTMDISSFEQGIYFLQMAFDGKVVTKKFVKY